MNKNENPYRPPDSSLEHAPLSGKPLSRDVLLAKRTAQAFLAYASVLPILRPLEAYNTLTPYGAQGKVGILLAGQLEREGPWLVGLTIMAMLMWQACRKIAAGDLAKVDRLRFACAGGIALDVVGNAIALKLTPDGIIMLSNPIFFIIRCAWLAYLIHRLNKAGKQP